MGPPVSSPGEQRRRPHPQRGGAVERKVKTREAIGERAVPMDENGPPRPVCRLASPIAEPDTLTDQFLLVAAALGIRSGYGRCDCPGDVRSA